MPLSSLPSPGTGYFVAPRGEPGVTERARPGILLLASSWGLRAEVRAKADELADAGFTVLAPDLNNGQVASSPDQARALLMEADMNVTASLVQSSLRLLQAACPDSTAPVGVLGYGAGASWALWLSVRFADQIAAVSAYYGTQSISFSDAKASYLIHLAELDDDVSDDDAALMGLNLQLARRDFRIEVHPGSSSGFAEADHPDYDGGIEAVTWRQTLEFFASSLR